MPLKPYSGTEFRLGQMVQIKGTFMRYDSDTERVRDRTQDLLRDADCCYQKYIIRANEIIEFGE